MSKDEGRRKPHSQPVQRMYWELEAKIHLRSPFPKRLGMTCQLILKGIYFPARSDRTETTAIVL